ncbi:hypothetical protein [Oharaeibacter diazotrophicus]|uniref:O-antigen ligase-like membrane protein n=1 Tax=Oharaeibacter diazotrophicus TaxID=1920512 RepID=A0A4R6RKG0_9HYPH|nr:hypothetical protein [Oharaeibacter diazotrophicus]TDP86954.1 hypothetical protein EDD54_0839 [Oharaeibacter diazotrophicus]BBE71103.1 hypothetical protein OHA_1_00673 [Pleomorphomonas sp. SM30]GLS77855.1 hypothetical protein GCM10007904_31920 [Oharaeibacter diazotrophicus]
MVQVLPVATSWFFGLAVVVFPLLLAIADKASAVVAAALLGGVVATVLRDRALGIVLIATVFQNLIVSLASPYVDFADFNFVRAFSFLDMVVVWVVVYLGFLAAPGLVPAPVRRMMVESTVVLAVVFLFMVYGVPKAGGNAIVYTRNIATPILLFQIALLTSVRHRLGLGPVLVTMAVAIVFVGGFEWLARDEFLAATNGDTFWRLNLEPLRTKGILETQFRLTGISINHPTDFFKVVLFNTALLADLDLTVLRLYGPNGHPISYGYLLAFLMLYLGASRRFILATLLAPLLIFASAKGAVIVILVVVAAFVLRALFGERLAIVGLAGLFALYIAFTIVSGLRGGDYHVLGLMGGLYGFAGNPIGHGIGVGGNLEGTLSADQWSAAQASGRTATAVESAVGVLLYQMGLAAFVVLGFYWRLVKRLWRLHAHTGIPHHLVAAVGTLAILVNGIFQEEALFAPLAMGLMLAFAGTALGSAHRVAAELAPEPAAAPDHPPRAVPA